jgi:hypothetical protein
MAVSGTIHSRTNTGQLLKTIFDDDLQEAVQNETPFLKYARQKQFPLDGSAFTIAVHTKRNTGVQYTNIGDDLPDSGQAGFVNGTLVAARVFAAFQIDNEIIKLADRDEATFSERVEAIYDDAKNGLLKDGERVVLGDGSGVLCTIATASGTGSATQTFTVLTTPSQTNQGVEDTRFLEEGMLFNVWDNTGTTSKIATVSGGEETTVWGVVNTISTDGITFVASLSTGGNWATAISANYILTRAKNSYVPASTRVSKEANGMALICDNNSSFMGIDGTTATGQRRWRGTVLDASGGTSVAQPFSAGLIAQAIVKARQASAMMDHPNVCYTHPAQTFALVYGAAGTFPDIRYSREDVNKFGTPNRPVFNIDGKDVALETCLDMMKSKMFLFKGDALLYGELQAPGLEDFGDISILPAVNTSTNGIVAAQKGWFSWRFNLGCLRRNAFIQITNLAVPTGL